MATYYVNDNSPTNPGSVGSPVDPFGVTEFIAAAAGAGPHDFFHRGMGTLMADLICGGPHTHQAWDLAPCGSTYRTTPWRLVSSGAFTGAWAGGTISDAVLQVIPAGADGPTTSVRVAYVTQCPYHGALGVPGVMTNCTVIGAVAVFVDGGTVTRCVFSTFGGGGGQTVNLNAGGAALTHVNSVTWRGTWGTLATGANNIDGGGQLYSCAFSVAPVWNDPDQMLFNLFAHRGVGAGNSWAEPMPTYTDIATAFDGTTPREATAALPATFADWSAHLTPPLGVRTHNLGGSRVLTVGIGPAYPWGDQTFDGYDLTDPTAHEAWIVDGYGFQMTFAGFDGNSTVFKRLAIRQGTLGFNPAGNNYNFRFYNCYLRHQTQIQIQQGRPINMYFFGCSVYTPVLFMHDSGACTYTWQHCVFFDTVCGGDAQATISFYRCRFSKSQAEVEAAILGAVTFTDCTFGTGVSHYPPEVVDVSPATMNFWLFGIPSSRATGLTDWTAGGYDHGFADEERLGPGAFYFLSVSGGVSASPDHGTAPLEVEFSVDVQNADPTGYDWDFGDGSTSEEASPSHTYTMPGEWVPSVTVTLPNGETITYYGTPIYVYDADYAPGMPNPNKTDTCYRTPVKAGDGYGPSEYRDGLHEGYDWLWPPARVGCAICYDEQNREKALVWDAKTQLRWLVNDPDVWEDRTGRSGYAGQQIISEIHHKADSANQGEHVAIVHTESHDYFKPYDVARIGESGYDDAGYPTDMRVDDMVHVNGSPTEFTRTRDVPKDGDIVFQERIEGRSIQHRKRIWGAPWWYTGVGVDYDTIDKAQRPTLRQMVEEGYQLELVADPLFHVSRNVVPTLNLATGVVCTGGAIAAVATGPDGKEYSGVLFAIGAGGLSDTLVASMAGNFTMRLWVSRTHLVNLPARLWQVGTLLVRVVDVVGQRTLSIFDGVNPTVLVSLSGTGVDWALLAIVRDGLSYRVYENGSLLGTWPITVATDYGTALNRCGGDAVGMFDACVVPRAVSADALGYYYEDVLRGGRQVLPEY